MSLDFHVNAERAIARYSPDVAPVSARAANVSMEIYDCFHSCNLPLCAIQILSLTNW